MRRLLPVAALCLLAATPRRPVLITTYASPVERDFGRRATELVAWRLPGSRRVFRSRFAPGFASRDAEDPKHPDFKGVAMEGGGWISPELHRGDPALRAALKKGYRALVLQRWDERTRTGLFELASAPIASDGAALVEGVSAAVRDGNRRFPAGRRVRLYRDGVPAGERLIHDECSSCRRDDHLDLYEALGAPILGDGRWEAELLPERR